LTARHHPHQHRQEHLHSLSKHLSELTAAEKPAKTTASTEAASTEQAASAPTTWT
jgi:hypothetical protein